MSTGTQTEALVGYDIDLSESAGVLTARVSRIVDIEQPEGHLETETILDREVVVTAPLDARYFNGRSFSSAFGSEIPAWLGQAVGL